jgi:hypothetical protein
MSQTDDIQYKAALSYLKRGFNEKRISDELVKDGMSHADALSISAKVWKENGSSRRDNAKIVLGYGVFLLFLGISFLVLRFVSVGEIPPILSPTYLFFALAFYLFYKGWRDWQTSV